MSNSHTPQVSAVKASTGSAEVSALAVFFARKERLMMLAMATAIASCIVSVISLFLGLKAMNKDVQFVVMDPAGGIFLATGRSFDQAKELHVEQALLATTALLLRNPNDFDLPEVLQAMYLPQAHNQAASLKGTEASEFLLKQIHQQPSVTQIEALETRPNLVRIQVSGQLVRKGVFRDQGFAEVLPFVLDLVLKHNTDLLRNRRQPTVVSEFSLRYETKR